MLTIVAEAGVGLVGAGFYGMVLHEDPLAAGALMEALLAEASENKRTEVFARFVPVTAGFDQQVAVLNANGFRCGVRPAYVEGNTYLSCGRPVEGTGYCRHYSYQIRTGEIIDTPGSAFDRERDRNSLGRCEEHRQHFFALADEIGDIGTGGER